jgi:hypothetical protein
MKKVILAILMVCVGSVVSADTFKCTGNVSYSGKPTFLGKSLTPHRDGEGNLVDYIVYQDEKIQISSVSDGGTFLLQAFQKQTVDGKPVLKVFLDSTATGFFVKSTKMYLNLGSGDLPDIDIDCAK